ncbi:hypothetical protein SR38_17710 [Atlantibacter hermannii]|nr:hypothetical protein SR38_17710 [Atlantibacter hermannii]
MDLLSEIVVFPLNVVICRIQKAFYFGFSQRANLFHRTPKIKVSARQTLIRGDETSRTNHNVVFYHGTIQDDRSHADENTVADSAAV